MKTIQTQCEMKESEPTRIPIAIEIDHDLLPKLEALKVELGLNSRGAIINILLRELLISEGAPTHTTE
jgi:hypothetical protein